MENELLKFYVQGSAAEPYRVSFWKVENNFKSACTCPAGKKGMYCKHRLELMEGEVTNLVSDNYDDTAKIVELMRDTPIEKILEELNFLKQCEIIYSNFKKMLSINQNEQKEVEKIPSENEILEIDASLTKNGSECRLYNNEFKYLGSFFMTLPKIKKSFPNLVVSENKMYTQHEMGIVRNFYTQNEDGVKKVEFYLQNKNNLKNLKEQMKLAMR